MDLYFILQFIKQMEQYIRMDMSYLYLKNQWVLEMIFYVALQVKHNCLEKFMTSTLLGKAKIRHGRNNDGILWVIMTKEYNAHIKCTIR